MPTEDDSGETRLLYVDAMMLMMVMLSLVKGKVLSVSHPPRPPPLRLYSLLVFCDRRCVYVSSGVNGRSIPMLVTCDGGVTEVAEVTATTTVH